MKLIFTSYTSSPEYNQPVEWLKRIEGYTGILENLAKDHIVVGIEHTSYDGVYEQKGVNYFFMPLKKKTIRFPWRMHDFIKTLKPDIVFINGFIFPFQLLQLRKKLGGAVKIIVIHRSEKPFTGIKKYLQRITSRYVDAFLFTSGEFGKQWVENGNIHNQEKIHEVMHGSSVFHPSGKAGARSLLGVTGSPVFLWVGRLDANKDPLTVVKAFKDHLLQEPRATLYMIYHSEELIKEVKEIADKTNNIKLIGKLNHAELQDWYNASDFIISGSHYEGGGIAVCEAMSCGCIPLITDIISFRKMTGPGKCGLLYQPGNREALLVALSTTKNMDIEKERVAVLEQFNKEISFEAIAQKINQVIKTLRK